MLQRAADAPLGDWFEYTIGPPIMDLAAAPYGGARYPVEARMDDRIFVRFHLDAGIGDVIMQPVETIGCRDWLGFAGIESPRVRMIGREQQFAEKIHAYTLPRNAANSRVKDLVDMALLIGSGGLDKPRILDALRLTFERRGTHDLPAAGSLSRLGGRMRAPGRYRRGVCGGAGVFRRSAGAALGAVNVSHPALAILKEAKERRPS
jgi:hypothetical protein